MTSLMLAALQAGMLAAIVHPPVTTVPARHVRLAVAAYGTTELADDIVTSLTNRQNGPLSGRALGNEANRALWSPAKVQALYDGLVVAQATFFPEFTLQQLARLVVSEGAQESTGDYRLGVVPVDLKDWRSQGFLQATPGSVLVDYQAWGEPIADAQGNVLLRPEDTAHFDLGDPRTNVLIWAWYTKNSVVAGVSLNEYANRRAWNIAVGHVTRDFGNCQFTWLAGPHNDRHRDSSSYTDYYNRIADYFIQSGFGSHEDFDRLIATQLGGDPVLIHDATAK